MNIHLSSLFLLLCFFFLVDSAFLSNTDLLLVIVISCGPSGFVVAAAIVLYMMKGKNTPPSNSGKNLGILRRVLAMVEDLIYLDCSTCGLNSEPAAKGKARNKLDAWGTHTVKSLVPSCMAAAASN